MVPNLFPSTFLTFDHSLTSSTREKKTISSILSSFHFRLKFSEAYLFHLTDICSSLYYCWIIAACANLVPSRRLHWVFSFFLLCSADPCTAILCCVVSTVCLFFNSLYTRRAVKCADPRDQKVKRLLRKLRRRENRKAIRTTWLLPHDNLPVMSEVRYKLLYSFMSVTTSSNKVQNNRIDLKSDQMYPAKSRQCDLWMLIRGTEGQLLNYFHVTWDIYFSSSCDYQDKKDNWAILNVEWWSTVKYGEKIIVISTFVYAKT